MKSTISRRRPVGMWARVLVSGGLFCANASLIFGQTQPPTNRSKAFGPDACCPADPSYIHAANETGGIPMFLQRSEAAKSFHLVRETSGNNVSTVFWATGSIDRRPEAIAIAVDSMTKRITFAFSVDTKGSELKLTKPSGGTIREGLSSAEVTELNCGRILTVNSPEAGEWPAEIAGTGRFWLEAEAQSSIHLIAAEFVNMGGRPGHEGLSRENQWRVPLQRLRYPSLPAQQRPPSST